MNKQKTPRQILIDNIHEKINMYNNKKGSDASKKVALLRLTLSKIRTTGVFFGESMTDILFDILTSFAFYKDLGVILRTKRNRPTTTNDKEDIIIQYFFSASPYELIYLNGLLDYLNEDAYYDFKANFKKSLYYSGYYENLADDLGAIARYDMQFYMGLKVIENRYSVKEMEDFFIELSNSRLAHFGQVNHKIKDLVSQKERKENFINMLTNENQTTLYDFEK